jgi:hypothetical protein
MRPRARWVTIALLGSVRTFGETLHVPRDYLTIQACIDAAVSGEDECVVAPGAYHETIDLLGKAVTVRSSAGADVTTIDATGIGGSVVICASGEGRDTVLEGFTITGGTGTDLGGGWMTGGGMYNEGSSPTVTHCVFTLNSAHVGGGMRNASGGARVTNCVFSDNTVVYSGGGIANSGGQPEITASAFSGNASGHQGGAIYNWGGSPNVSGCMIRANEADVGGGMWNGENAPRLANCVFVGNRARFGAGMLNGGSDPEVNGCTFFGNAAHDGGAMYNTNANPTVTNSIFWGDHPQELVNASSAPIVDFSNILGGLPPATVDEGGNTNLDPLFIRRPDPGPDGEWDGVDDDYGDLRLQPGSRCINAGDPNYGVDEAESYPSADLDGHPRVLCGRLDKGAYEFGIGDYDCNRGANLADFAAWEGCMTEPSTSDIAVSHADAACAAFDFNADGDVDLADFHGFQRIIKR